MANIFSCLVKCNPVKQEASHTVILPSMVSFILMLQIYLTGNLTIYGHKSHIKMYLAAIYVTVS